MKKASNPVKRFIPSISYEEHRRRAKEIFENEVIPQMKVTNLNSKSKLKLTSTQKAHLNCKAPI